MRLWERIREDLRDFRRGFVRICETLEDDLQGFTRLWERIRMDSLDFGRRFTRIHETLEEDSQGFMQDFGRGFAEDL